MTVRDFLNRGIRIVDINVASGSIPQSAPTLVSHGYPQEVSSPHGTKIRPPFVLVICDIEGGTNPTATIDMWGYAEPPSASPALLSNWQKLGSVEVADSGSFSTMFLIPVIGFTRFDVPISAISGSPTSVRMRLEGISNHSADVLMAMGVTSIGLNSAVQLTQDATYNSLTGSNKVSIDNGVWTQKDGSILFDVTDGTDATYYYYFSTSQRRYMGLHLDLDGGSGTVTATVEATGQIGEDPTALNYIDVSNDFFGSPSWADAGGGSTYILLDNSGKIGTTQWIRIKIVAASGSNDADWRGDLTLAA